MGKERLAIEGVPFGPLWQFGIGKNVRNCGKIKQTMFGDGYYIALILP